MPLVHLMQDELMLWVMFFVLAGPCALMRGIAVAALASQTLAVCLMLPANAAAQHGRFLEDHAPLTALSASPP